MMVLYNGTYGEHHVSSYRALVQIDRHAVQELGHRRCLCFICGLHQLQGHLGSLKKLLWRHHLVPILIKNDL